MYGLTDPTYIMWIRASPVWDASLDVGEFDLGKARQLLVDAGYPNGFETKIQANNGFPELVQFDQIVQADLAKIGISASIEPMDATQANGLVTQGKFASLNNHTYAFGDQDPAMQFTAFVFRPDGNASRFQSDQYRQIVDMARREPDWDKRLALYRQIATFVKDEAFVLPIANGVATYGLRWNVRVFRGSPWLPTLSSKTSGWREVMSRYVVGRILEAIPRSVGASQRVTIAAADDGAGHPYVGASPDRPATVQV